MLVFFIIEAELVRGHKLQMEQLESGIMEEAPVASLLTIPGRWQVSYHLSMVLS